MCIRDSISVEGVAVSSIEDVQDILSDMEVGDEVTVIVFRDGEELVKRVKLGSSTTNQFFFDIPEEGGFALEFFRDGVLDSLFLRDDLDLDGPLNFWGEFFNENFDYWDDKKKNGLQENISERATLGVLIDDIGSGVLISQIIPDSPADLGGLRQNDVIIKMDKLSINGYAELVDMMNDKRKGDLVELEIERAGKIMTIEVEL